MQLKVVTASESHHVSSVILASFCYVRSCLLQSLVSKPKQQVQLCDNVQASQAALAHLQGATNDLQDINTRLTCQIASILEGNDGLRDEVSNVQRTVHQVWSLCGECCTLLVHNFPVLLIVLQKI